MEKSTLLKELMEKTMLDIEKLSKRTKVKDKSIENFISGKNDFNVKEYQKIAEYFGISLDTLISGKPTDHDAYTISRLEPSGYEVIDSFINACNKVINELGLKKHSSILVPTPKFEPYKDTEKFVGFQGGVFLTKKYNHWNKIYMPYVDIKKVIELDNFEIFDKFKDYPQTFGQLRNYLNNIQDSEGLKKTEPKDRSSNDWLNVRPVPEIKFSDIIACTDVKFFEYVNISEYKSQALYMIDENHPKYWNIMNILLRKGAYLRMEVENNYGESIYVKDIPVTKSFEILVSNQLK